MVTRYPKVQGLKQDKQEFLCDETLQAGDLGLGRYSEVSGTQNSSISLALTSLGYYLISLLEISHNVQFITHRSGERSTILKVWFRGCTLQFCSYTIGQNWSCDPSWQERSLQIHSWVTRVLDHNAYLYQWKGNEYWPRKLAISETTVFTDWRYRNMNQIDIGAFFLKIQNPS